jgi:hypothetical protein
MYRKVNGFQVGHIKVARTRPDGEPWDPAFSGSAPDLRVQIEDAAVEPATSPVVHNTLQTSFDEPLAVSARLWEAILITVRDRDPRSRDPQSEVQDKYIGQTSLRIEKRDLEAKGAMLRFDSVESLKLGFDFTVQYPSREEDPRTEPLQEPGLVGESENSIIQRIRVEDVRVAPKTAYGQNWDRTSTESGKPDIRVDLKKLRDEWGKTSVKHNVWEHTFDEFIGYEAFHYDRLRIRVVDRDFFVSDHFVGECCLTLLPGDLDRGYLDLSFGAVEHLRITFEPEETNELPLPNPWTVRDPRVE